MIAKTVKTKGKNLEKIEREVLKFNKKSISVPTPKNISEKKRPLPWFSLTEHPSGSPENVHKVGLVGSIVYAEKSKSRM